MRNRRWRIASVCAAGVLAATALVVPATAAQAAGYVPGQFLAKQYVEAFGRLPDAGGWQSYSSSIAASGCSAEVLADVGFSIFTSGEFTSKPYDNAARMLALYRAALNREPDQAGLDSYRTQLDAGSVSWPTVVAALYDNAEFDAYASAVCDSADGSEYFGDQVAPNLPVAGPGFQGTQAQLQAALDATPPGGTVFLAQKAVVRITGTLTVPDGVTLSTTGTPSPSEYALMGRLVRQGNFGTPMVRVMTRGDVANVWIDGSRGSPFDYDYGSTNVEMWGGDGNSVTDSRMGNTAGWTNLQAIGTFEFVAQGKGAPCPALELSGNLIDTFSSSHNTGGWSDGLSVACEGALVEGNQIVDATDVGIVLFRASPAVQSSLVRDNVILNAGNPSFAGLVADPLSGDDPTPDFGGARIQNNTVWTAESSFMHIGISVGTRPWYQPGGTIGGNIGHGVTVRDNTTGGFGLRATLGISVSGMTDATVTGNSLSTQLGQFGSCPQAQVGASVSAGLASGTIQPYSDVFIQGCLN